MALKFKEGDAVRIGDVEPYMYYGVIKEYSYKHAKYIIHIAFSIVEYRVFLKGCNHNGIKWHIFNMGNLSNKINSLNTCSCKGHKNPKISAYNYFSSIRVKGKKYILASTRSINLLSEMAPTKNTPVHMFSLGKIDKIIEIFKDNIVNHYLDCSNVYQVAPPLLENLQFISKYMKELKVQKRLN